MTIDSRIESICNNAKEIAAFYTGVENIRKKEKQFLPHILLGNIIVPLVAAPIFSLGTFAVITAAFLMPFVGVAVLGGASFYKTKKLFNNSPHIDENIKKNLLSIDTTDYKDRPLTETERLQGKQYLMIATIEKAITFLPAQRINLLKAAAKQDELPYEAWIYLEQIVSEQQQQHKHEKRLDEHFNIDETLPNLTETLKTPTSVLVQSVDNIDNATSLTTQTDIHPVKKHSI